MLGVLLAIFFVALVFVLVSIIKFKLHPFLALLLGCRSIRRQLQWQLASAGRCRALGLSLS